MVEFEIETIDIHLSICSMSTDYFIPIFSDHIIPIFRRQEVTYLQTRYIVIEQSKISVGVRDVNEATTPRGRGHNPQGRGQDPSRNSYYYLTNILINN